MGSFVLVHGALGGGWQFAAVARRLRRAGHQVFAPTLTGVGERAHLASPEVGLDTHVRDVVALVEYEGLTDAVLVGTDYGGVVVTAAVEELAGRVSRLVYVAGLVPQHGRCTLDLLPAEIRERVRALAREHDGWRIPADEPLLGLWSTAGRVLHSWAGERLTPFPIRCLEQPVRLPADAAARLPRDYVELAATDPLVFGPPAARALREGWGYHRLQADHGAWLDSPGVLAGLLQLCSAEPSGPEDPPPRNATRPPTSPPTSADASGNQSCKSFSTAPLRPVPS